MCLGGGGVPEENLRIPGRGKIGVHLREHSGRLGESPPGTLQNPINLIASRRGGSHGAVVVLAFLMQTKKNHPV